MYSIEKGHDVHLLNCMIVLYYLQDGNIITEVTLTVLNLPVNLTDIECVYHVNAASLDSIEATTNITRYDAATGTVGCLVPTALYALQELLYLCKLNKAVLMLSCRQIIFTITV